MKDYIELIDEQGYPFQAEVVITISRGANKYIVYNKDGELYAVKYKLNSAGEYIDLDTNLTKQDYELLEEALQNENR